MSPKQSDAVDKIIAKVRAAFGADSVLKASEGSRSQVTEVIPTGLTVIDRYLLGCGGLPVGRMSEMYGDEGAGKTTFAFQALAGVQREGGIALYADVEQSFSEERAAAFGVNLDTLILLQPSTLEDSANQMIAAIEAVPHGVGPVLAIYDSIAAAIPKVETEGEVGDAVIGVRARVLGQMCRKLTPLLPKKHVHLMFINQVREKIGIAFGDPTTTPGGRAVKFAASMRIQLFPGKAVKEGDKHTGKDVTFKMTKNRLAPPQRKIQVRLDFEKGWDNEKSILDFAKDYQLIAQNARGKQALEDALKKLNWEEEIAIIDARERLAVPDDVEGALGQDTTDAPAKEAE